MKSTWSLSPASSQAAPADDRGDRRAGEEGQHQARGGGRRGAPGSAARARACRRTGSRPRPASTAGRRRPDPRPAARPGRRAAARGAGTTRSPGRQVVAVADQAVLAGLARPVEVLQRVGDQEPVRARDDAAAEPDLQQQAAEHGQRQRRQRRQRPRLDGIQAADERPHTRDSAAPAAGRAACARATRRTRARASSSSRVTGTITRGIDSREPGAVGPRDPGLGDAEAERARHRERLGVERPAVQPGGAVGGLGRGRAPELEAAEEVARRLAQQRAAEQPEAAARDPAPHRLAPPDRRARAPAASRRRRRSARPARASARARGPTGRSRRRSAAAARRWPRASRAAASRPCRCSPGCAARARRGSPSASTRSAVPSLLALSTTMISCSIPSPPIVACSELRVVAMPAASS